MAKRSRSPATHSPPSTSTISRSPSPSPTRKQQALDIALSAPLGHSQQRVVLQCDLPPHRKALSFDSHEAYENHYNAQHTNRCLECLRNFPSQRFLDLHIAENHDSISEARRARGEKTYACFVEDCDKVCSMPQKRKMHLIDKHFFPKSYDFLIVNDGIDGRTSMLRPPVRARGRRRNIPSRTGAKSIVENDPQVDQSSIGADTESRDSHVEAPPRRPRKESKAFEAVNKAPALSDDRMEGLTRSMSALNFIPQSVRFGRGRGCPGFSRR